MTERKLRNRISKFVLLSYCILFLSIIIYSSLLPGFDNDELVILIGFLSPITAVYVGAVVKYAIANKNIVKNDLSILIDKEVNQLYITITNWAIPLHFLILFSLVNLAAFNLLTFDQAMIYFPIIETFFGAYIGMILGSLFNVNGVVN